jgi:hypothetical protein
MKTLVFWDVTDKNYSFKQIWHILDLMKENFSDSFYPFQNICINGKLILWKGRTALKEYISSK